MLKCRNKKQSHADYSKVNVMCSLSNHIANSEESEGFLASLEMTAKTQKKRRGGSVAARSAATLPPPFKSCSRVIPQRSKESFLSITLKKLALFCICISFLSICSYGQELRAVKGLNGKWGFVGETGTEVIPFKYDEVGDFSEGLARVKKDRSGYWGFIDKTGKEIIPLKYLDVGDFSEGLARVQGMNRKWWSGDWNWGFIDKTGKMIIPVIYDAAGNFSEGLARVKYNGRWGFINKAGNAVISFEYKDAKDFSEGLAQVKIKRKWGYIDKEGREVIPNVPTPDIANNIVPKDTDNKQPNNPVVVPNVVVNPDFPESSSPQKFQFGIAGGWYFTNEVVKYEGKDYYTNDYLPGFQLGFVGNVPLGKYLALQPALLYAQQRAVERSDYEYEKRIINHLQLPINLQVKLGKMPIWLQAGPYFGYAVGGKYKWKEEVGEGEFESGSKNIKIGNSKDDEFKPFDCGISSGIALKTGNIQFTLNSMVGLANTSTSENKKVKEKTNGVSFSVTYFLGR